MKTHCNQKTFDFQTQNSRKIVAHFNGGIISQFAACFTDYRDPDLSEFTVKELPAQRIFALALGYEGLSLENRPIFSRNNESIAISR